MMPSATAEAAAFPKTARADFVPPLLLFIALVTTAVFGQYLFYAWNISPAVIWPPAGIALAGVLLGGYRMWLPIAAASFISALASPGEHAVPVVIAVTVAQTVASLAGASLLQRLGFDPSFGTMRTTFIFFGSALLIAMIAPTIITAVQVLSQMLAPDMLYASWSRGWAGRVLSIMVLTPLIIALIPWRPSAFFKRVGEKVEAVGISAALMVSVYLLFWTPLGQSFSFLLLLALLVSLFYVALRLNIRAMAVALFLITAFGMAGPILGSQVSATPVSTRLFSIELFIILIAPIFLAFSALMKERRAAAKSLEEHVLRLEEAMRRLNSEDAAKNEFLAVLAHELRNPLAAILSSVELLKVEKARGADPTLLEAMDRHSRGMARILDDLLDISRISYKKLTLQKETLALCDIVDRAAATAQAAIHAGVHTLSVTKPPEKIYIGADRTRLEQVFVNLLNNAAKYTKPGGLISVQIVREDATAVVRVRDSGVGIPGNLLTRVFEPFFQVERKTPAPEGLGIGLPLTRQLVELHGGTIEAHSEGEDRGSEFVVRLPVSPHPAQPSISRKILSGGRALRKAKDALKILVVDDNEVASAALGRLLDLRGHMVALAGSGAEALAKAREFRPQVIILDIGLGDIDGYTVARTLRKQKDFSSMLVALTGYGQAEDRERAARAGFQSFLTKPVGLKEIEMILRKVPRQAKAPRVRVPTGAFSSPRG